MRKIQDGKQTIFVSSSENMNQLSDSSVDVIITSPPYNVGKNYSTESADYNDRKSHDEYISFLSKVFQECYRVISDSGVFFLNIGDSARDQGKSEDVVRCAVNTGFKRLQTVIWVKSIFGKGHYTPSGGNRRLNNLWEFIFVLVKSKSYKIDPKAIGIPYADKSNIGRYSDADLRDAGDLWFIPYTKTTGATIKKGHEAPFPIELPLRCLQLVPTAEIVLDPFAGTGSTLCAAKILGKTGYGFEILPREDVIKQRLNESIQELKTPLLPQLEFYAEFSSQLLEEAFNLLPQEDIESLLKKIKKTDKRKFLWACKDLDKLPSYLSFLTSDTQAYTPNKLQSSKISSLDQFLKKEPKIKD